MSYISAKYEWNSTGQDKLQNIIKMQAVFRKLRYAIGWLKLYDSLHCSKDFFYTKIETMMSR